MPGNEPNWGAKLVNNIIKEASENIKKARKRLAAFIKASRNLKHFGKDLNWDDDYWDIRNLVSTEGYSGKAGLWWSNIDSTPQGRPTDRVMLERPFGDFARAYVTNSY